MISDGIKCYEYNEGNQLKRVKRCSDGQVIADYVYDYTGRRIVKKSYTNGVLASTTTSWTESFETKANVGGSTDSTSYYYANDELIAKKNPDGTKQYIHNDHLGSTSVLTRQDQSILEQTTYYPFGEVRTGGTGLSRYQYTGKEKDQETGLNYYGARYYDSSIRRFTQADTFTANIYDPQDLNEYSYVKNNPLRYTDPTGHAVVFKNGMIYSDLLSPAPQQKKMITTSPLSSVLNTYAAIQNTPTRQSGSSNNTSGVVLGGAATVAGTVSKVQQTIVNRATATTGTIYRAFDQYGNVNYIGKTIDFARRQKEWARLGREIQRIPGLEEVPIEDLSSVEQANILEYGLENLKNIRNAISPNNPGYRQAVQTGIQYLKSLAPLL